MTDQEKVKGNLVVAGVTGIINHVLRVDLEAGKVAVAGGVETDNAMVEEKQGWYGIDLDGTLAHYDEWKGEEHIGAPIPEMVARVKQMLEAGKDVRIFTARIGKGNNIGKAARAILLWCTKHIGRPLPITCQKDFYMIEMWDDQCVKVERNTGRVIA